MIPTAEPEFTKVKVYYASDRKLDGRTAAAIPAQAYNDERNDTGSLQYGFADVSIPKIHQKAKIEEASVFTIESPKQHIMVLSVEQKDARTFFDSIRNKVELASKKSGRKEAFVFVHGYNNTFADSMRRTAQLAYDLNFDGAPIAYTWPWAGIRCGSTAWPRRMRESELSPFEKVFGTSGKSDGCRAHPLIAHSMGNRVLANASPPPSPSPASAASAAFSSPPPFSRPPSAADSVLF